MVRFHVDKRDVWSSLGSTAVKGCVGDEVVTLYCHHHQVVCEVVVGQACVFKCW